MYRNHDKALALAQLDNKIFYIIHLQFYTSNMTYVRFRILPI